MTKKESNFNYCLMINRSVIFRNLYIRVLCMVDSRMVNHLSNKISEVEFQ